jgi:hypothetical protein
MSSTILGIVLMVLGLSFLYKCAVALFFGKTSYWEGFLPFTIVSPLLIHLPAGEKSLIKTAHAWWVHVTLGPIFFFVSLLCLASGADQLGLPGTESVNYVLTLGREDVPPAVIYDRGTGYKFPIFKKAADTIYKGLTSPVVELKEEEKVVESGK